MSPWGWVSSRHGGGEHSRRPSFSKSRRRKQNTSSSPPESSPTTVLSPRDSTETSSVTSCEEPHVHRIGNHLGNHHFEVEASCFEPINCKTWTVTTDKPSDLLVEVNEISFHLHKVPILSRSALLHRLAAKFSTTETACINLGCVPGGAISFALAAKCCYGIDVQLTPANVAGLRCVSEYLEMTETLEEGNVTSKAEAYLTSVVLTSWHESMAVLTTCEHLLPWAEHLEIIHRCSHSIARKACNARNERNERNFNPPVDVVKISDENWWYDEVSSLTLHCFENVMHAMERNLMSPGLIGGALELFGHKWLPGVLKQSSSLSSPSTPSSPVHDLSSAEVSSPESSTKPYDVLVEQNRNRFMIERIVAMVPQQRGAVACRFLLRLLRAANMFNCSPECRAELEKKAGQQLDQASLSDLLIPSFCHTSEYLYDVDLVSRLLDRFLSQEQGLGAALKKKFFNRKIFGALFMGDAPTHKPAPAQPSARCKAVAKLLDSYLAEVARDSKLPLAKFQSLAEAVPVASRVSDDGLYRAIDTYLKIHSGVTEMEKKKLCRSLDSQRFSVAACMHAARNERLPLRIVVQILFGAQLKLREAISQSMDDEDRVAVADDDGSLLLFHESRPTLRVRDDDDDDAPDDAIGNQQAMLQTTNQMEIRALQTELTTVRIMYTELERNHATMMEMMEKLQRSRRHSGSSWATTWRKSSNKGERPETPSKQKQESSSPWRSRPTTNAQTWRNSIS